MPKPTQAQQAQQWLLRDNVMRDWISTQEIASQTGLSLHAIQYVVKDLVTNKAIEVRKEGRTTYVKWTEARIRHRDTTIETYLNRHTQGNT